MTGDAMAKSASPGFVHGMGTVLVKADWPLLGDEEVRGVLRHYERNLGVGTSHEPFVPGTAHDQCQPRRS